MKVSTVKAKCNKCGQIFKTPLISDFSYGTFIYSSNDGQHYKHLDAFNNKTWEYVSEVTSNKKTKDHGTLIRKVMGQLADKNERVLYYQTEEIICPTCGQQSKIIDRDTITGFIEIPIMTFNEFEHLTVDEKTRKVLELTSDD